MTESPYGRIRRVESLEALEDLLRQARERPVWLFKHSLACGASAAALEEYRRFVGARGDGGADAYTLVEIQRAREVSDEVARRTGVRHQSPQVLLLADGEVRWHASHWSIQEEALERAAG